VINLTATREKTLAEPRNSGKRLAYKTFQG
jgi:hypothetical protein